MITESLSQMQVVRVQQAAPGFQIGGEGGVVKVRRRLVMRGEKAQVKEKADTTRENRSGEGRILAGGGNSWKAKRGLAVGQ